MLGLILSSYQLRYLYFNINDPVEKTLICINFLSRLQYENAVNKDNTECRVVCLQIGECLVSQVISIDLTDYPEAEQPASQSSYPVHRWGPQWPLGAAPYSRRTRPAFIRRTVHARLIKLPARCDNMLFTCIVMYRTVSVMNLIMSLLRKCLKSKLPFRVLTLASFVNVQAISRLWKENAVYLYSYL